MNTVWNSYAVVFGFVLPYLFFQPNTSAREINHIKYLLPCSSISAAHGGHLEYTLKYWHSGPNLRAFDFSVSAVDLDIIRIYRALRGILVCGQD